MCKTSKHSSSIASLKTTSALKVNNIIFCLLVTLGFEGGGKKAKHYLSVWHFGSERISKVCLTF